MPPQIRRSMAYCRHCLEAGLVEGKRLTVDGTVVAANASPQRGAKPEQLEGGGQGLPHGARVSGGSDAGKSSVGARGGPTGSQLGGGTLHLHDGPWSARVPVLH